MVSLIKGDHCIMSEGELILYQFNLVDSCHKDAESKYSGAQVAKKLNIVLNESIEKMKEISSTYNIRYFVILHCFISFFRT